MTFQQRSACVNGRGSPGMVQNGVIPEGVDDWSGHDGGLSKEVPGLFHHFRVFLQIYCIYLIILVVVVVAPRFAYARPPVGNVNLQLF